MTRPGMPANSLPPNNASFMRRLQDLERQVRMLQGARTLENASIGAGGLTVNGGGNIKVNDGGSLTLAAADGTSVLFAGRDTIPDGSGRTQEVVVITRDDGTVALAVADLGTVLDHPHQQALQWYDRAGNNVISDDTTSGVGLARPHIPTAALVNANTATWPATNATTPTEIASCYVEYQHPRLQWALFLYAPAGVTGLFELDFNGTSLGTYSLAGGGSGAFYMWQAIASLPAGLTFGNLYTLSLKASVTAGAGTVAAQSYLIQGVQS